MEVNGDFKKKIKHDKKQMKKGVLFIPVFVFRSEEGVCGRKKANIKVCASTPMRAKKVEAVCVYYMPVFACGSRRGLGAAALAGLALALR